MHAPCSLVCEGRMAQLVPLVSRLPCSNAVSWLTSGQQSYISFRPPVTLCSRLCPLWLFHLLVLYCSYPHFLVCVLALYRRRRRRPKHSSLQQTCDVIRLLPIRPVFLLVTYLACPPLFDSLCLFDLKRDNFSRRKTLTLLCTTSLTLHLSLNRFCECLPFAHPIHIGSWGDCITFFLFLSLLLALKFGSTLSLPFSSCPRKFPLRFVKFSPSFALQVTF